jgi:hypothetical protein
MVDDRRVTLTCRCVGLLLLIAVTAGVRSDARAQDAWNPEPPTTAA